jgi:hypothetical protein
MMSGVAVLRRGGILSGSRRGPSRVPREPDCGCVASAHEAPEGPVCQGPPLPSLWDGGDLAESTEARGSLLKTGTPENTQT